MTYAFRLLLILLLGLAGAPALAQQGPLGSVFTGRGTGGGVIPVNPGATGIPLTSVAPLTTPAFTTCLVVGGCTGITSYALGDILYATGTTALGKLSGNTTTTRKFLRQTGNGAVSAAPTWDTILGADISGVLSCADLLNDAPSCATDATNASNIGSGTLPAGRMPALTGDITTTVGAVATTLASVNANVGSFGSSTSIPSFTVNAKGLITAAAGNVVSFAGAGIYDARQSGVVCDNSTNDVANINAAMTAAAAANLGRVILPSGTCIAGGAQINMVSNICLEGNGRGKTLIKALAYSGRIIAAETISNFCIRHLAIDANNFDGGAASAGIYLFNSNTFSIDHVDILNMGRFGIVGQILDNGYITDNRIFKTTADGTVQNEALLITATIASTRLRIERNEFSKSGSETCASFSTFKDNYIHDWGFGGGLTIDVYSDLTPYCSDSVDIINNRIVGGVGIDLNSTTPTGIEYWGIRGRIIGNDLSGNSGPGLSNGGPGTVISGNTTCNNGTYTGGVPSSHAGLWSQYVNATINGNNAIIEGNYSCDTGGGTQTYGYEENASITGTRLGLNQFVGNATAPTSLNAGNFATNPFFHVIGPVTSVKTYTFPNTSDTVATLAVGQTFSNKTIALGINTISGTTAQFNAALTDNDFATLAGAETLSNKTLASPIFTTSATGPLLIGGTGTTSTLSLQSTSGVGTTGADIVFKVGNNGGTEAARVLNNGNVGFGMPVPGYRVDILGSTRMRHTGGISGSTAGPSLFFSDSTPINIAEIQSYNFDTTNYGLKFRGWNGAALADIMSVIGNGNVGIGTTGPNYPLDIFKTSAGAETTALNLRNNDSGSTGTGVALAFTAFGSDLLTGKIANVRDATGQYSMRFHTWNGVSNAEHMRITYAGNVGIGGTPGNKLHVIQNTSGDIARLQNTGTAGPSYLLISDGSGSDVRYGTDGGGNGLIFTNTGKQLRFDTNGGEAMTINTAKNLNVNSLVATPAGGSIFARLVFGTTAGFGVYYGSGAPTVSAAQGSIYIRSDGSSTSTRLYVNTDGGTTWTNFTSATYLMLPDQDNKLVPANDNWYAGRMAA